MKNYLISLRLSLLTFFIALAYMQNVNIDVIRAPKTQEGIFGVRMNIRCTCSIFRRIPATIIAPRITPRIIPREVVKSNRSNDETPFEMLISSKILAELSKIAALVDTEEIKIYKQGVKIIITIDNTKIIR